RPPRPAVFPYTTLFLSVGMGRAGLALRGNAYVGRKAEWPTWTPTDNMIARDPINRQYAGGVPGGINNPLGARALYLYRDGRDTIDRKSTRLNSSHVKIS